tara:strand:- start:1177 stop:1458 length:282 start_codon:yes stop_codon:yes gene_type:complete
LKKYILLCSFFVFIIGCVGGQEKTLTSAEVKEICLNKKRLAEGPTGVLSFSTGTKGSSAGAILNFHSDYLIGKDPNIVYVDCMFKMNSKINKI